jgi:hypothetical protein
VAWERRTTHPPIDRLSTGRLPGSLPVTVRSSVAAGVQVAKKLHDDTLRRAVRAAFVHGMDLTLIACGAPTLAGAVVALLFLARRPPHAAKRHAAKRHAKSRRKPGRIGA